MTIKLIWLRLKNIWASPEKQHLREKELRDTKRRLIALEDLMGKHLVVGADIGLSSKDDTRFQRSRQTGDALVKPVTILDAIVDAKAEFLDTHVVYPSQVTMNQLTYDRLKKEVEHVVKYRTEPPGHSVWGMKIEIDDSLVDGQIVPT